jgi:hypothetical protein
MHNVRGHTECFRAPIISEGVWIWESPRAQRLVECHLRTPTSLRMIHGASFSSSWLVETELGSIGPRADISLGIFTSGLKERAKLQDSDPSDRGHR